ncbi:MAG: acetyl-coenzyme A synthetase N-terminal domain-containing protein, partial [Pseudomonadota bacterium]
MAEEEIYPAQPDRSLVDAARYRQLYRQSIADPDEFWREQGQRLNWIRPYSRVRDVSYRQDDLHIRWYDDGLLNVAANCIDRHLESRGDQIAIIWEGDDPHTSKTVTYRELHGQVCRMA